MKGLMRFLSYNNAVPIGISLVTLSFGAAFAASDEVRGGIYASETRTISVDNTYIAGKDLSTYLPRAEITQVTEDERSYFVTYQLSTIDVADAVWRDVTKTVTMRVDKSLLGDTLDLGLHVTKELGQIVDAELARLRETQTIERRAVTQRIVATEYSGLVGRFLDPSLEELPGYEPVVVPPPAPENAAAAATAQGQTINPPIVNGAGISITVLGDNPARVARNGTYADLGVAVSGVPPETIVIRAFVDGGPEKSVGAIVLDTSYDRVWHIRYEATAATGASASAERYVLIGDAQLPGSVPSVSESDPTVPTVDPEPEPVPAAEASSTPSSEPQGAASTTES